MFVVGVIASFRITLRSSSRSIFSNTKLCRDWIMANAMKRTLVLIFVGLAAVAVFALLVHAVLVAANVSEPAASTVQGLTSRRLWATTVSLLGLVGVVV